MHHAASGDAERGYAVVDLETTGLKPGRDHIIEIGVVLLDPNGAKQDEWSTKVRQPIGRSVGAKEIHGLNWWSLSTGMSLHAALTQLAEMVRDRIVVAHNAEFDTAFLIAESEKCGVTLNIEQPLCTLQMSRTLGNQPPEFRSWQEKVRRRYRVDENLHFNVSHSRESVTHFIENFSEDPVVANFVSYSAAPRPSSKPSHKLSAVCERYGVPFTTSHRALEDARACADLLPLLLRDFGIDHAAPLLAEDSPLPGSRRR